MKIVLAMLCCIALAEFGCTSAYTTYPYRAITDDCNCELYRVSDSKNRIDYLLHAQYRMDKGIITSIEIEFRNNSSKDSLIFERATVKISSRNIAYQYNNKSLPIPLSAVPPRHSDRMTMSGREVTGEENWHKIAGEQLTITIKGLHMGGRELPQQVVTFIPQNPKLGRE